MLFLKLKYLFTTKISKRQKINIQKLMTKVQFKLELAKKHKTIHLKNKFLHNQNRTFICLIQNSTFK